MSWAVTSTSISSWTKLNSSLHSEFLFFFNLIFDLNSHTYQNPPLTSSYEVMQLKCLGHAHFLVRDTSCKSSSSRLPHIFVLKNEVDWKSSGCITSNTPTSLPLSYNSTQIFWLIFYSPQLYRNAHKCPFYWQAVKFVTINLRCI